MRLKYSEAMNQPRACMRCAWWEPFNSAAGHCKRMPPVRVDDDAEGAWPMTGRADGGDTWHDGEREERPFARGWRQKSIEYARAELAKIGVQA